MLIMLGTEWMGASTLLYLSQKSHNNKVAQRDLQARYDQLEQMLVKEVNISISLRKRASYLQKMVHDKDWQLQETIAELKQQRYKGLEDHDYNIQLSNEKNESNTTALVAPDKDCKSPAIKKTRNSIESVQRHDVSIVSNEKNIQ
jgi:hypothetical protein